jgi:hypothetical protein
MLDLSKQRGYSSKMRSRFSLRSLAPVLLPAAGLFFSVPLQAQASVASDLWRVAQGTLVTPAALSDDGAGPLWTPAVMLAPGSRVRVGIEAVQAPGEIGVNGGVLALSFRGARLGVIHVMYGRLGIANVGFTETSPELVGGSLQIYNQTFSVGLARRLSSSVTGGIAVRYLSGRLAFASRSQFGVDVGAQFNGIPHLRVGLATRFFDPTFGRSSDAANYSAGAEFRTGSLDAWGAPASLALRYGVIAAEDDGVQHLLSAGISLGTSLSLDVGATHEATASDDVWRSLLGVGIGAGRYSVRIGRDGGINGFGPTYRFGLTAVFK